MVYFNEEQLNEMKQKYSNDEIKTIIVKKLRDENVPMPIIAPTLDESIVAFENMKRRSYSDLIIEGEWFSRYEYRYKKLDLYIKTSNDGLKASGHFTHDARMKCDGRVGPGPIKTWNSDKFLRSGIGAIFSLKMKDVSDKTLKMSLQMRKYVASQFKPSIAKSLYEMFNAEDVLDFSMGWGDRLAGALATPNIKSYTGIDPNTETHKGYTKIVEQFNTDKRIDKNIACAESFDHGDRQYDLVFTSPPYFDIERYSQEETQSFKKYKQLEDWKQNFLYKAIENFWPNVKEGGVVGINISDVYSSGEDRFICDDMNDFISTLPGANYCGCIGYKMAKRTNSRTDREGTFCEPVWVWSKGKEIDLNELLPKNELDSFINF